MNTKTDQWPEADLERVDRCPICSGQQRSQLHEDLKDHLFGTPGTWTLYRCSTCNSAYLDPRPTLNSIGRAYSQYYTHVSNDIPTGIIKTLSRRARNGYLNRNWGSHLVPASYWLGKIVAAVPSLRAKADHELMRSFPKTEKGHALLDVGCGSGQFLELIKAAGWDVRGIDVDEKAVAAARKRGLDVAVGGLELYAGQNEIFDAITLSHVIEHVHDPLDVLKNCYRLLKKGGCLWIETPNLDGLGYSQFGKYWRGLEPPRHLVIFTTSSLRTLLKNTGFRDIKVAPWRPLFRQIKDASIKIMKTENRLNKDEISKYLVNSINERFLVAGTTNKREFSTLIAKK